MEVSELDQIPEPRRRRFFKAGLYLFKALALLSGLVATACGFMLLYALWSSHSALSTGNMLFVGAVGLFGLYIGFSTVRDLKTKENPLKAGPFMHSSRSQSLPLFSAFFCAMSPIRSLDYF